MIRAVLFDLDGTLVDALGAWGAAFEDALEVGRARMPSLGALGTGTLAHLEVFRPLLREAHQAAGGGEWSRDFLRQGFLALLERFATPDAVLAAEMFAVYEAAWPGHVRVYPEVHAVLAELATRYRIGVVSNGLGSEQREKIGPLGLDRYAEVIAISGELGVRKPDPAIFRHALEALGVHPGESIHVGDDIRADIAGARAANLAAGVWVNRDDGALAEDRGRHESHPRPDFEVSDLGGLAALLERLGPPAAPGS